MYIYMYVYICMYIYIVRTDPAQLYICVHTGTAARMLTFLYN